MQINNGARFYIPYTIRSHKICTRKIIKCSKWLETYSILVRKSFRVFCLVILACRYVQWFDDMETHHLKFICVEFGLFVLSGYDYDFKM